MRYIYIYIYTSSLPTHLTHVLFLLAAELSQVHAGTVIFFVLPGFEGSSTRLPLCYITRSTRFVLLAAEISQVHAEAICFLPGFDGSSTRLPCALCICYLHI